MLSDLFSSLSFHYKCRVRFTNVTKKSYWASLGEEITSLTCVSRQLIDTCGIISQILMDFLVYELKGFPEVTHVMNNWCQTTETQIGLSF